MAGRTDGAARRARPLVLAAGLALAVTAIPASATGATPRGGSSAVPSASGPCAAGSGQARGFGVRPDDGSSFTRAEVRRIEHRLQSRLAQRYAGRRVAPGLTEATRIDVHVHVIGDHDTRGPKRKRVAKQLKVLRTAFTGAQSTLNAQTMFRFRIASFERLRHDRWHVAKMGSRTDEWMRRRLHRGTSEDLNLYVHKPRGAGQGTLLGWATLPWELGTRPNQDGVALHQATLPSGVFRGYNRGDTAVHEVGHWLGLYHTFQGRCSDKNDEVKDTPPVREPSYICDEDKDTCLQDDEPDAVHNFMDYAPDACMNQFTSGQVARMDENWLAFRDRTQ
jgi:hypothetical protein